MNPDFRQGDGCGDCRNSTSCSLYRPATLFLIADICSLVDVGNMIEDNLNWLSQWYLAQCDGDWEHSYGVKIDTLDNPGWTIKINLTDTPMQDIAFERVQHGKIGDDFEEWQRSGSWWVARVEGHSFDVSCGPLDLSSAIGVFRRWVEASA
ncbi:immunity 53 family protein [Sphingobium sp. BHU LFT2]|uniref:immunity 53 family protein n=1 Tax=Sphingobium sp. BHU LFT2 TaxID=2807634 RepID=UPI002034BBAE|nr:immunity 53 family protein [Sphingobium sp. BHU LFT2]